MIGVAYPATVQSQHHVAQIMQVSWLVSLLWSSPPWQPECFRSPTPTPASGPGDGGGGEEGSAQAIPLLETFRFAEI